MPTMRRWLGIGAGALMAAYVNEPAPVPASGHPAAASLAATLVTFSGPASWCV